ncbi:MAG: PorT family protein [Treponema sp.]|nr:PorT family protein [Treponema sp.]
MKRQTVFSSLFLFFLCAVPGLFAQNVPESTQESAADELPTVALVPFWGENRTIIGQFGEVLRLTLENEGVYRPETVDMENLPADIPEGGFPPYICPSPSLTKTAPYSVTGEIVFDEESSLYHLRLYLWEMETNRLVYTDEGTVRDREECERYLPSLVNWIFSWLNQPAEIAEQFSEYPETLPLPPEPLLPEEKWLYLGLRVGPSVRFYSREPAQPFAENKVYDFLNITAGLQVTYQFLSFLSVQAEALFTNDHAPYHPIDVNTNPSSSSISTDPDPFTSFSLMFPLALKYTYRQSRLFASALAGVYFNMPLGEMQNKTLGGNFGYSSDLPLGYTLGIDVGTKLGPGSLFLDLRWAADLGETRKNEGDLIYKRSMVTIAIGYEIGFFTKKKK